MKSEKGSIVVEVLFVVPALMLVVMLVAHAGRITETSIILRDVASVSARRASQASSDSMSRVAEGEAKRQLFARRIPCRKAAVVVKLTKPVDAVHVGLRCVLRTDGLGLLGVRPRVITATAVAPVDRYRHQ